MGRLAILSGDGALPLRLAACVPDAVKIGFEGVPNGFGPDAQMHRYEKMGALFEALRKEGVTEVVMGGAMSRPPLDPSAFDTVMQGLAPRLIAAMQGGDDALLRLVIAVFEEQGFTVRGAHEIDRDLTLPAGLFCGDRLSESQEADRDRATSILAALGPQDVGQGTVVEAGLCLGIETLQGTDALLVFVAGTQAHLRKGQGVFVKAPKPGQDLRVDMPTIGPDTIDRVEEAGLSALVLAARSVIVLDQDLVREKAEKAGVTIVAEQM